MKLCMIAAVYQCNFSSTGKVVLNLLHQGLYVSWKSWNFNIPISGPAKPGKVLDYWELAYKIILLLLLFIQQYKRRKYIGLLYNQVICLVGLTIQHFLFKGVA